MEGLGMAEAEVIKLFLVIEILQCILDHPQFFTVSR